MPGAPTSSLLANIPCHCRPGSDGPCFYAWSGAGQGFTLICVSQWGWWAWAPGCLVSMHPPMAAAAWISLSPKIEEEFFPWRFTSLGPVSICREECFVFHISKPSQTAAFAKYNNLCHRWESNERNAAAQNTSPHFFSYYFISDIIGQA